MRKHFPIQASLSFQEEIVENMRSMRVVGAREESEPYPTHPASLTWIRLCLWKNAWIASGKREVGLILWK